MVLAESCTENTGARQERAGPVRSFGEKSRRFVLRRERKKKKVVWHAIRRLMKFEKTGETGTRPVEKLKSRRFCVWWEARKSKQTCGRPKCWRPCCTCSYGACAVLAKEMCERTHANKVNHEVVKAFKSISVVGGRLRDNITSWVTPTVAKPPNALGYDP